MSGSPDTRPWYEKLRERDPGYFAEVFASFTPEQWEACVTEQEKYGIPRRCTHMPTLMAIAHIAADHTAEPARR